MNILDIIILICLVPAIVQGLRKGFIAQLISIISIIAGVWASARFANIVGEWVSQYISASEQIIKVVSFALILIGVFILLALLGRMLEGLFKLVMLGWLNKLLGVVFSLVKCLLILSLVVLAFHSLNATFNFVKPSVMDESVLYPHIKELADTIFPYIKSLLSFK